MIDFGWGDYDHTYGVLSFDGHWTTAELYKTVTSLHHELKLSGQTVNLIIDLRHSAVPPTSIMSMVSRAIMQHSSLVGRVIIVSKTLLWKRLYDAITHNRLTQPLDIHFVDDMDKAYHLLITAEEAS